MDILTRDFYSRDTLAVARDLLGRDIVRVLEDGTALRCRITETEAYIGRADKACHAYGYKRTSRTETLFAPPGTAYIYLIYGMYHCLNFVTEAEGEPAAVLIRGAVPVENGDIIAKNRFHCKENELNAGGWPSPGPRTAWISPPRRADCTSARDSLPPPRRCAPANALALTMRRRLWISSGGFILERKSRDHNGPCFSFGHVNLFRVPAGPLQQRQRLLVLLLLQQVHGVRNGTEQEVVHFFVHSNPSHSTLYMQSDYKIDFRICQAEFRLIAGLSA